MRVMFVVAALSAELKDGIARFNVERRYYVNSAMRW